MIKITSKKGLIERARALSALNLNLRADSDTIVSQLSNVEDYDGINVQGAAQILKNDMKNIMDSANQISDIISEYANGIENYIDTDDLKRFDGVDNLTTKSID